MKKLLIIALIIAGLTIIQAQENEIIVQGNNFTEKLDWLNIFVQSNGNYIIEVNSDERIASNNFNYTGKNNITITLRGVNVPRTIILNSGNQFTVGSGVTLVLDNNITIQGSVSVSTEGNLIMNNGAVISSAGVNINGGTFTMNGGRLPGSLVNVTSSGTFTMNGGEISGNRYGVNIGSGGFISTSGTFIMNGGIISGTTLSGVQMNFGGGNFTMNDGIISNNRDGGVNLGAGTFIMNGGKIVNNTITAGRSADFRIGGAGVKVVNANTSFIMNGGEISGNRATGCFGGGVYLNNGGSFTMNGGDIIDNNATPFDSRSKFGGGGVSMYGGNFTMNNGTISGNTSGSYGGGVYVAGTFIMNGGTISGNIAREYGGGVFISTESVFAKTGGVITGYTSDTNIGNVVKNASDAIQNFRGHAVYAGSTNTVLKIKETTAENSDNLSYGERIGRFGYSPTVSGAWDN